MVTVPPEDHPVWKELVTRKMTYDFRFLAARILMVRITSHIKQDPSPENIARSAQELRAMFAKNIQFPDVQRDLKDIFGM
jgi:hypothetical protein